MAQETARTAAPAAAGPLANRVVHQDCLMAVAVDLAAEGVALEVRQALRAAMVVSAAVAEAETRGSQRGVALVEDSVGLVQVGY